MYLLDKDRCVLDKEIVHSCCVFMRKSILTYQCSGVCNKGKMKKFWILIIFSFFVFGLINAQDFCKDPSSDDPITTCNECIWSHCDWCSKLGSGKCNS